MIKDLMMIRQHNTVNTTGLGQRGTAYVEYFILAGAMAVAAAVLWQNGSYQGATAALEGEFETQMDAIKGSVPVD